jgi:hypothetical protein
MLVRRGVKASSPTMKIAQRSDGGRITRRPMTATINAVSAHVTMPYQYGEPNHASTCGTASTARIANSGPPPILACRFP